MVVASGNNAALGRADHRRAQFHVYLYHPDPQQSDDAFHGFRYGHHGAGSLRRCYEILTEKPDLTSPENAVRDVPDGSIDFENVSFRYSQKAKLPALQDVDLHIPSGSTVGILGATGSSKSTLVQLIPGCTMRPKEASGRRHRRKGLRSGGPPGQRGYGFCRRTRCSPAPSRKNLRWGNAYATDEELAHACKLACADEFITGFPDGYDTHIEQGGSNVSGGQKQRLCIARALLKSRRS